MINAVKSIVSMLKNIFKFFDSVVDFIISFFKDLASMIKMLGDGIAKIPDYLGGIFPASVLAIFVLGFSCVLIYKILGRD